MHELVGAYRLERVLGEGSTAVVHRAHHTVDGTVVALKILKKHLAADETFRRRFLREARAASEVRHPNLVAILDHGESDGRYYLASAYAAGGSLAAAIVRHGRLPIGETVLIANEVASGLDALHAHGIVHRDIKAANVMLDVDGRVAITDFGLAKGARYTALTTMSRPVGSPAYLSPERITRQETTPAGDIYALGCLVHECLSGSPPFSAPTLFQLAFAHMTQDAPSLAEMRRDVTPALDAAVRTAMAKDPAHRPATATRYAVRLSAAAQVDDRSPGAAAALPARYGSQP
ncbi:MAG: serine/threonine protein kinase [Chloroflexi bacterium]|nr:serine/threonine protein kinase [Chloroflexota bacterium]